MAGLIPFNRRNRDLASGFEDFYDLMDDFFTPRSFERASFRVDVQENDGEYLIEAELPGVNKDEVSIDLNDGRLAISVRKDETVEDSRKNYIHRERRVSSASRVIQLPETNPEGIKARMDNGVLSIIVQKQEKRITSRKIEIE